MTKIVVIDDKPNILKVMKMILEKEGYAVETAGAGIDGLNLILREKPDLVISDIKMPDIDGPEIFHILNSRGYGVPFIFITAYASVKDAVSIIKDGAIDYITKPIDYGYLKRIIARLINRKENLQNRFNDRYLVGSSRVMEELYSTVRTVSETSSTVLITGESGTGQELVARAIHTQSKRRDKPFVPVNC